MDKSEKFDIPPKCTESYSQSNPTQRTFAAPDAVYNPPQYGWCEDTQRNKPQSNTLAAATFIFASGGMSLAWSVGFLPYFHFSHKGTLTHLLICWFIAVILGAIIAAIYVQKLEKRTFNIIASVLVLLNGILYASDIENIAAIVIARYCDGIAFGLTIIPAIMAGSEQSVKRFRGLVLSIESIGLTLGITMRTVYTSFWDCGWEFKSNQMHGALAILFGGLALLFAFTLTIESPTFYLRRGQEAEAINSLRRLQVPHTVTTETFALLYENKRLLEEDQARGNSENIALGLVPMARLCVFRAFVAMSFSLPLSHTFMIAVGVVSHTDMWPIYLYSIMRMTGTILAIFTLDTIGRRLPTGISILIGGCLLIGVSSIFSSNISLTGSGKMETVIGLMMIYQVLAGLVAPASTTYLGEAFSISVKQYFILATVFCENIVQIIIGCAFTPTTYTVASFGFALGALQIVFALFWFVAMPETKNTTLREALEKFKNVLKVKIGQYVLSV